jgi:hypothetical protein
MKKVLRLSESDLINLVKKVLSESDLGDLEPDSFPEYEYRDDIYANNEDDELEKNAETEITQQVAEDWYRRKINRVRLN